MPSIKNVSGDDLIVPFLGGRLVLAGQEVEVPAGEVYSYTCQAPNWAPADDDAQAEHDKGEKAANPNPPEEPAGNANREAWVAYVLGTERATAEHIKDMSRDDLRDAYRTQEG